MPDSSQLMWGLRWSPEMVAAAQQGHTLATAQLQLLATETHRMSMSLLRIEAFRTETGNTDKDIVLFATREGIAKFRCLLGLEIGHMSIWGPSLLPHAMGPLVWQWSGNGLAGSPNGLAICQKYTFGSPLGPHFTQNWVPILTNLGLHCMWEQWYGSP